MDEDIISLDALLAFTKSLSYKKFIWKHHSFLAKAFYVSIIIIGIVGAIISHIWKSPIVFLVF